MFPKGLFLRLVETLDSKMLNILFPSTLNPLPDDKF